jgi:hypothetical protein
MFFNSINAQTIKSKPVNLHFGKRQVFKIVPSANTTGHFLLEVARPTALSESAKKVYCVHFDANPAISGTEAVAVVAGATAALTAAAIKAALEIKDDVKLCWIEDGNLFVEAMWFGKSAAITNAGTDLVFTTHVEGFGGFLGATEGGVEISPEAEVEDITSDQTGSIPLASIIKSTKYSVKSVVKELTQERMELLFGKLVGEAFTPVAGTKVIGMGTSKVGTNVSAFTGELILKPVSKSATDHSENIHFFSCAILPGALSYGQDQLSTEVTFTPYVDITKDSRANLGCFGDGFQDLRPEV